MKVLLLSDLHFEFIRPGAERTFLEMLDPSPADVVVLAGDICSVAQAPVVYGLFASAYRHVVFVTGNHEYYYSNWTVVDKVFSGLPSNVHRLDGSAVEIEGQRFIGGTLWFRDVGGPVAVGSKKYWLSDFRFIGGFEPRVYEVNAQQDRYLRDNVKGTDVVVTHHLPSEQCVTPPFVGDRNNCFFVHPMDDLILSAQPRAWLHGHSHSSLDVRMGKTRLLRNPYGYFSVDTNKDFSPGLVIDV